MQIVIAVLLALLSAFNPSVISRNDNHAVLYMRATGDYVCATRYEDNSVGVGVGRDKNCADPDTTDIDMWYALGCDGQYELDIDNTVNFYYRCMKFNIYTTHVGIVLK
jgi:hypothetical protein